MTDTTPEALAIQVDIHRRMSGIERLQLACEMSDAARELALVRLRAAHPDWTGRQLARELLRSAFDHRVVPPALG
jgi:hypothetical protein